MFERSRREPLVFTIRPDVTLKREIDLVVLCTYDQAALEVIERPAIAGASADFFEIIGL